MPTLPARVAALAALLVALPAPAEGGPRCSIPDVEDWREYRSAHFVLATDVSPRRAKVLVAELEKLHALVRAALFGYGVDVPGRFRVVAFANAGRFERQAGRGYAGYVKDGLLQERLIVFPYEGSAPVPEVVAHELAHLVSFFHFPRQHPWFAEGLAEFVSSVARERDADVAPELGSHIVRGRRHGGGRWAGLASAELLRRAAASTQVGAKELLEWTGAVDAGDPGRFHAASWVLYHFLWNQRSRQFTDYQERLAAGDAPRDAWLAAFPEWDPARPGALDGLDAALAAYRAGGRYFSYRVEAREVDASFTESRLAPADVHVLLLAARGEWDEDRATRRARLEEELDEALREDPAHPLALWWRARSPEEALPALRRSTAARPADYRAWLLLASVLDGPQAAAEREAALRKAVALEPGSPKANNDLAWFLVGTGRAREARPYADRALDLAPWDPAIVDTLAAVAFGIGQCRAAVVLQRRAAELYPPGAPGAEGVRRRAAEYEAGCERPAPAAAPK